MGATRALARQCWVNQCGSDDLCRIEKDCTCLNAIEAALLAAEAAGMERAALAIENADPHLAEFIRAQKGDARDKGGEG